MNGMSKRSSSHGTSPSASQLEDVTVHSLGKFYISGWFYLSFVSQAIVNECFLGYPSA